MPKRPTTFRQSDVTRAITAVRKAGLEVARVEVDTTEGKVVLTMIGQDETSRIDPLDDWLARNAH